MLSLFSKSSRHLETSPMCGSRDTRSCVSVSSMVRPRGPVSRAAHVRGETEAASVVSDNPGHYTRTTSLVSGKSVINGKYLS